MQSRTGFLMAAAAAMLLVGVTVLQGWWTERWAEREDRALEKAALRLERSFPESFGDWKLDRRLETSKAELDRAGAVGSISRIYRSTKTKTPVSAFVVCATPHDASGHTPDRCYPGAGFEIAEPEHRETIDLADGRVAEAYTGTFAKQGQTLRVYWTYGVPDKKAAEVKEPAADGAEAGPKAPAPLTWVAPQIARIALNDFPAVYKLYAIVDQTAMTPSRAREQCGDFIGQVLPAFEAAAAAEAAGRSAPADAQADESTAEPAAEPAAATAG